MIATANPAPMVSRGSSTPCWAIATSLTAASPAASPPTMNCSPTTISPSSSFPTRTKASSPATSQTSWPLCCSAKQNRSKSSLGQGSFPPSPRFAEQNGEQRQRLWAGERCLVFILGGQPIFHTPLFKIVITGHCTPLVSPSLLHIPVRSEPRDRIRERLLRRRLRQAQHHRRLGRIEPHLVLRHLHPGHWRARRYAGHKRKHLIRLGHAHREPVWNLPLRRRDACKFLQQRKRLRHRPIAVRVAQNISLAETPALRRQDVSHRHVAHMRPVQ